MAVGRVQVRQRVADDEELVGPAAEFLVAVPAGPGAGAAVDRAQRGGGGEQVVEQGVAQGAGGVQQGGVAGRGRAAPGRVRVTDQRPPSTGCRTPWRGRPGAAVTRRLFQSATWPTGGAKAAVAKAAGAAARVCGGAG
ncbi:hypothetical protein [Streptomyces sp. NBC_00696]|uniref:hypothetical protein n=1 Tax=Streptomyces sp. NBC_00696 TaxID=2903672 RepID=UPI002E34539E|nr:hypothetical protein [Streptomyces sp. NBC_00696]